MGIQGIQLNSPFWSRFKSEMDIAAEVIFEYQQTEFIKTIIAYNGGKIVCIYDGTYGTRGHHSQDCLVTVMTKVSDDGQKKIIGYAYEKRFHGDEAPGEGIHTCSARKLEPIATKAATKSAFRPKNGLELIAVNADGDAQDCFKRTTSLIRDLDSTQ